MNNPDSSDWVETPLEATWQLSPHNEGSWEWSPELAAWMRLKLERELTPEELDDILRMNYCSTLDELIRRLSVPKHL
ncbi:hypothetical protein NDA01_31335 [Trichocoleus desertorum AS-A10]|uniref:hypothetical protein n=1 Tax=Trichocoleus desertorum TaxID=1481672 RepID=UPI0032999141